MHSGCRASTPEDFLPVAFAPQDRNAEENGLGENRWFVPRANSWGSSHSRRETRDHLRFVLLSFPFSIYLSAVARVYAQDECVLQSPRGGGIIRPFANCSPNVLREPGRRFAGDVVPPRVRFPDGHAPGSALSGGGCRRRRRRRRRFCCSRRCIHHREVIATGGVAEDYLPSRSFLSSPPAELCFSSMSPIVSDYHRVKYV